jgi:hypothetical protein
MFAGCTSQYDPSMPAVVSSSQIDSRIVFVRAVEGPNTCDFYGTTGLADGINLQTRLYLVDAKGYIPLDWWPANETFMVRDGKWAIEVQPSDFKGSLSVGPSYILKVWVQSDPSITKVFPFDLGGPPLRGTPTISRT